MNVQVAHPTKRHDRFTWTADRDHVRHADDRPLDDTSDTIMTTDDADRLSLIDGVRLSLTVRPDLS